MSAVEWEVASLKISVLVLSHHNKPPQLMQCRETSCLAVTSKMSVMFTQQQVAKTDISVFLKKRFMKMVGWRKLFLEYCIDCSNSLPETYCGSLFPLHIFLYI